MEILQPGGGDGNRSRYRDFDDAGLEQALTPLIDIDRPLQALLSYQIDNLVVADRRNEQITGGERAFASRARLLAQPRFVLGQPEDRVCIEKEPHGAAP